MEHIKGNTNNMTDKEKRFDLPPVKTEIEGDRWNWYYVCEDCHGSVNWKDEICIHCGRRLDWNG